MAIRKKDEILEAIKGRLGDDTSDEALGFIEDVTDTLNDLEDRTRDTKNWKEKYETNDKEWRQRYRDRFFGSEEDIKEDFEEKEEKETDKPKSFMDLFKTE